MAVDSSQQQPPCFAYDAARATMTLTVHVQPGAKSSAVAGLHGDALKIRIAAPAVDNKANAALMAYLCEALGVRSAQVRIRHGSKGRRKVIDIGSADDALVTRLRRLLSEAH